MRLILVNRYLLRTISKSKAAIPLLTLFERMFTVGTGASGPRNRLLGSTLQEVVPLHDHGIQIPIRYLESSSVVFQCDADSD